MGVYDVVQVIRTLENLILEGEEYTQALQEYTESEVSQTLENLAMLRANLANIAEGRRKEANRMLDGARKLEKAVEQIEEKIKMLLNEVRGKKLKTERFNFGFRKSTKVYVENPELIPEEFIKVERTIIRSELGKALKAGEHIEGAALIENQSLSIR